jgi:hypothetical protein
MSFGPNFVKAIIAEQMKHELSPTSMKYHTAAVSTVQDLPNLLSFGSVTVRCHHPAVDLIYLNIIIRKYQQEV